MRDEIQQALARSGSASMQERTIDITTTGRRSGEARRIETVFYSLEDGIYLSGLPMVKPRAWLLNLAADPRFVFHLKQSVVADLPATAAVITDPQERARILAPIFEEFETRHGPNSPYPKQPWEMWLSHAPLARVAFGDD